MKYRKVLLHVDKINSFYGLSHILFDVSLDVAQGEAVCLLGRNGAGKTTTIRSIVGLTLPQSGSIIFENEDISKIPCHLIIKRGIRCAFSEQRVFGELTVRENLELGKKNDKEPEKAWDYGQIYNLFPVLKKYEKRWAKTLSGGEQQMLCIANALMGNPRLLLLDEPTIGLSPIIINSIAETIKHLKNQNISILLSEQNLNFAKKLGDRCYVIDIGTIRFQGSFEDLSKDEYVLKTYLSV